MAEEARKIAKPFGEIGSTGLKTYAGIVDEEFSKLLRGPKAIKMYREMADNSAVVSAALGTIRQMIRQTGVRVMSGGDTPEAEMQRVFVDECMHDMAHTWDDTISDALSMLPYGWAAQETVYKRRNGWNRDPLKSSRCKDGRIGWAKQAPRAQDSLDRWVFNKDTGAVEGMKQCPAYSDIGPRGIVTIPEEKLLLYRTESHKDNPEGRSILRGAFVSYYHEKSVRYSEGVGIERDLAGMPVILAPSEILLSDNAENTAIRQELEIIGKNIKQNEQAFALMPSDRDDKGSLLYELYLLQGSSRRTYDTGAVIRRLQLEQLLAMLSDWLMIGHESVGSFSLASSRTGVFAMALSGWLNSILEVWNRCAIPRLIRMNGWNPELSPYLEHEDIETPDLAAIGQFVQQLSAAGILPIGSEELQEQLLAYAGLNAGERVDLRDEADGSARMPKAPSDAQIAADEVGE